MTTISAKEALERLREGNGRFVAGVRSLDTLLSQARRGDLVAAQAPIAVVLGCSDSRVPAETVFDQGLGDLFVIRVAGNIVASSQVGSVEFAVERLGTRLVVVLGHTHCGAIEATLDEVRWPSGRMSPSLHSIVDRIRPAVQDLLGTPTAYDPDALAREAMRANVRASSAQLCRDSDVLRARTGRDGLLVVGAEYDLETGAVAFLE
jgi:carbonic anhydrase